jgi:Domain of unknown function (DUF4397)
MKRENSVTRIWGTRLAAVMVLLLMVALTGCLDDGDNTNLNVPVAYVSLYHGSPDAPDLDVEVDGRQINAYPFEYTDYTGYQRFYTGNRNFKFGPYASSSINIDTTVTFEKNKAYSVFVAGEFTNGGIVVLNDNSEQPASGKAKVRVINLSPDAGEVDLVYGDDAKPVAADLMFREASEFKEVNAAEYDFQVRSSGNDEVLLTVPDIDLQSRYYYTIIIRGFETPPGGNSNVLAAQIVVN